MILKSELVIQGTDKTGGAFAGVIKHAEQLKTMLSSMRNMNVGDAGFRQANQAIREQTRLLNTERRAASELAAAQRTANEAVVARTGIMARMQQRFGNSRGRLHEMAYGSGLHWMLGGYAAGHTGRAVAHDAGEFEHQRAMLTVAGMAPREIKEAVDTAMRMRVAGMSAADNLRAIGELRMVFGSTEHAIQHAEAVQKAAAALKSVNPQMDAENESYNLARSLELKGVSNDPAHFNRLQGMMVQAINASRGKITGADFMSFTNRAGTGTTRTLSDFFYTRIAPTLIQEMTGPTAGRALATMRRQLLGGHMQLQSAGEWMDLGLLNRNMVQFDKIGHVKRVKPGAIVDPELFSRDPYAWIQSYLMPAITEKFKKKGKTLTEEALAAEFATLFSDRYAENMATILGVQKQRIEKDARLSENAMGTDAAERLRGTDPLAAARDLGAGINSLLSALGSPLAKPAIETMNFLADWARNVGESFGKFAGRHPMRAMGEAGALGLGLGYVGLRGMSAMFGMASGLTGASVALDGSAAALGTAAASLEGAAVKLGLTPTGPVSQIPGAAKAGLGGFLLRGLGVGLGAAGFYFGSTEDAGGGEEAIYKRNADGSYSLTEAGRALKSGDLAPAAAETPLPRARPSGADISDALPAAKAEITGNAEIKVDVEVKTEQGFWSRISSAVSSAIDHVRINGPSGSTGSLGGSMPEVGPNHSISVPH